MNTRHVIILSLLIILSPTLYAFLKIIEFTIEKDKNITLSKYTNNGNEYAHYPDSKLMENGYRVNIFICEPELKKEWDKRSNIKYDSIDENGYKVKYTILRYLTSRGLKKDSTGIALLSLEEVKAIESGVANYRYLNENHFTSRLYTIYWEVEQFINGGTVSGYSVPQRIIYWQTALRIIARNPIIGVGTGDINEAFRNQYAFDKTTLSERWQLKSHNQFLTILITFGIIGLIVFLVSIFYPMIHSRTNTLHKIFLLIILLSMLTEDTIETQIGVTIFTFFYLFLMNPVENE